MQKNIRSEIDNRMSTLAEAHFKLALMLASQDANQIARHLMIVRRYCIDLADVVGHLAKEIVGPKKISPEPSISEPEIDELADTVIGLYAYFTMLQQDGKPVTDAELDESQSWAETLIDVIESRRSTPSGFGGFA